MQLQALDITFPRFLALPPSSSIYLPRLIQEEQIVNGNFTRGSEMNQVASWLLHLHVFKSDAFFSSKYRDK